MSNFTPTVPFSVEFEGDTITMDLRRLSRKGMMTLSPYVTGKVGALDEMAILDVSVNLLPGHITNFKGLKTETGEDITVAQMVEESYFLMLMSEIISKLFEVSSMGVKGGKNLRKQPSTSAEEPEKLEQRSLQDTPVKNGSDVFKAVAPSATMESPSGAGLRAEATPIKKV